VFSTSFSAEVKTVKNGINCNHFGKCPSCVLNDEDVKKIPSVTRVRQYFSSNVMNEHRLDKNKVQDQSLLFPVETPSSIVGYRSQARVAACAVGAGMEVDVNWDCMSVVVMRLCRLKNAVYTMM